MLDAAEKLFSARGFADVSIRDIAAAAGYSHALLHRYLGSKDEIYRAVLARNETTIRDAARGSADLHTALSIMLREGQLNHPEYLRLVITSALQGMPFATTKGSFPAMQRLIEIAEQRAAASGAVDPSQPPPRFVIAVLVALDLGWAAMEDWIVQATDLGEYDRETLIAWLEQAVFCIADGMLAVEA